MDAHETHSNGCRFPYRYVDAVLVPFSKRDAPSNKFTEVSISDLLWYWKPFVKTCREKSLRILKPEEEVPSDSPSSCEGDVWLVLAVYDE